MQPGTDAAPFLIRDAVYVWLVSVVGGIVGFTVGVGITGDDPEDVTWGVTAVAVLFQMSAVGIGCVLASRARGTGSLRHDLGLTVRISDWWLVGAGALLVTAIGIVMAPLVNLVNDEQSVVEDLKDATGPELAVLAITAGILAPVFEELLFRGLALRGLRRRFDARWAIGISAVAFGAVHLIDPSLGTLVRVPALIAFGVVSGIQAERTGDLSRSILLHVGFNLPAVLLAIFG